MSATMPDTAQSRAAILEKLRGVPWLAHCGPVAFELLLRQARVVRFAKHQRVASRGEPIVHLWIVLEGSIEMSSSSSSGRKFVVSYLPPGQPFGIATLFDGGGALHDSRAQVPSTLLRIPRQDAIAAMQADAELLQSVLRMFAHRSRRLSASLAEASMLPLSARLARQLLSLSASYGVNEGERGRAIALRIAQDDLAGMVGVTRQRLNAELKSMERTGLLRLAYARVVLLDEPALGVLAQEAES